MLDLIHAVNVLRKERGLDVTDRIRADGSRGPTPTCSAPRRADQGRDPRGRARGGRVARPREGRVAALRRARAPRRAAV